MDTKNCTRRKRSVITLQDKLNSIKQIDAGISKSMVAKDLGISRTTMSKWMKQRGELEKCYSTSNTADQMKKRSKIQFAANKELDEAVFIWFNQHRLRGTPLTGPMIQSQALKFYDQMGGDDDFTASNGWLEKWRIRQGVRQLRISVENLSANESVNEFTEKFLHTIETERLTPDQVFNCRETGLDYRSMPSRTLPSETEIPAPGFRKTNDRVTVMACSNASGTLKHPLMVVGKYAKPRAFNNLYLNKLPVFYRNQKGALMNSQLFKEWYDVEFIPRVGDFLKERGLPIKALLIVDNAPSHPRLRDLKGGDIRIDFLPPNVTSLVQPMDQGVLENLKRRYRQKLVASIVKSLDDDGDTNHLKTVTMKEVVFWISEAWSDVAPVTIQKSWSKVWPGMALCHVKEEIPGRNEPSNSHILNAFRRIEGCESLNEEDVQKWITGDDDAAQILSDEEIISLVTRADEDDDEDEVTVQKSLSLSQCQEEIPDRNGTTNSNFLNTFPKIEGCRSLNEEDLQKWITGDGEAAQILSDQEIISLVTKDEENYGGDSKDTLRIITPGEAKKGMELALAYFENIPEYPVHDLAALRRARDIAALHCEVKSEVE